MRARTINCLSELKCQCHFRVLTCQTKRKLSHERKLERDRGGKRHEWKDE